MRRSHPAIPNLMAPDVRLMSSLRWGQICNVIGSRHDVFYFEKHGRLPTKINETNETRTLKLFSLVGHVT